MAKSPHSSISSGLGVVLGSSLVMAWVDFGFELGIGLAPEEGVETGLATSKGRELSFSGGTEGGTGGQFIK
jgi:hypothetical protein